VLGSRTLLDALSADPLAFYPALAAVLLAAVALASGLLRGDVLALTRPLPAAWVVAAVAAVWWLQAALAGIDPTWLAPSAQLALAPLAVIALAYGPTPAIVALALTIAWVGIPAGPAAATEAPRVWLLGLELVVLGWLAIAPSPRRWWGSAAIYLIAAHLLAWLTAGLAWVGAHHGGVSLTLLEREHGLRFEGVAIVALVLALVPPVAWRRLFPGSSIAPQPHHADEVAVAAAAAGAAPEAVNAAADSAQRAERPQRRRRVVAPGADLTLPPPLTRRRRRRPRP